MNLNYENATKWLENLKTYWWNKDIENATNLFKEATFYQ